MPGVAIVYTAFRTNILLYRLLVPVALLAVAACMLAIPQPTRAQQSRAILDEVDRALLRGDAQALAETAGDRMEVSLFGSSTQYSRGQAQYVLRDFFQQYPPRRLSWVDMALEEGDRFATGRYWVEGSQQPLRVYIRLQASDSVWALRELRVENGSSQ